MDYTIAHTKPFFDKREADALLTTIETRLVKEGNVSKKLLNIIAQMLQSPGGVPVSSGTLGLHLALKCLGVIESADEVIIPDFACRSLYDSVKMAGGTPVLCDINLEDYSLCIDSVRARLNKRTRAIILPHMYGCPANIGSFLELNISLIEDCAHSLGAIYAGTPVGSLGLFSVFSFEGSKLVAAGEGGAILTRSNAMLDKLRTLRYGLNGHFAYHYRLSDLIAAIALIQIDKLPFMIEKRRHIAAAYRYRLKDLEDKGLCRLPTYFDDRESVFYRFVVLCTQPSASLIEFANERNVFIRNPLPSGCLSETFKAHAANNKNSRRFATQGISLPIYPDLTDPEIEVVVNVIHEFYESKRLL